MIAPENIVPSSSEMAGPQSATLLAFEKTESRHSAAPPDFIGSIAGLNGGHVFIERGMAQDYALMRASQLQALLNLEELAQDCRHSVISKETASDFRWLAAGLVGELKGVINLVDADAREQARQQGGQQ